MGAVVIDTSTGLDVCQGYLLFILDTRVEDVPAEDVWEGSGVLY